LSCFLALTATPSRAAYSPQQILQDIKSFRTTATVLLIAAHPDDENTQLITYLARGRGYRMAYLSMTRGDGGQNLLGPEFGDELGLIRTQELLAARRIDSGIQFFTRARDFGFSKDYANTLTKWDHQQVVSDVVRVIRNFRPDVVINRFSTLPGNTHGHHTASAVLGLEAYKLCGDPTAFPETGAPWKPKRILLNGGLPGFRSGGAVVPGATTRNNAIRIDIGGIDPVMNISYGAIAGQSRSQHKTQGFGNFGGGGRGGGGGPAYESFQLLDGEPATKDIMDGIDTTWSRFPGGEGLDAMIGAVIDQFDPKNPAASVPSLVAIHARVRALKEDALIREKIAQLNHIIQLCLDLEVHTSVATSEVVPGEPVQLTYTATVHGHVPVQWADAWYQQPNSIVEGRLSANIKLPRDTIITRTQSAVLPANTALSQPYWLREDETPGMFRVDDPSLIGRPENPPVMPVEHRFLIGSDILHAETITIEDEPLDLAGHRIVAIPPVALAYPFDVQLFAPGSTKQVDLKITAYRAGATGTLHLDAPSDWKVTPQSQPFNLPAVGDSATVRFSITAPSQFTSANITAHATIGGSDFDNQRNEIHYPHIPPLLMLPPARLNSVVLDLNIRGKQIGYIPGAGDSVAQCIEQMGYSVTTLAGADLTPEKLKSLDAVVIGIRAFNVRTDLAAHMPALLDYIQSGGTVIEQYNTAQNLQGQKMAPYDFHIGQNQTPNRVTDEKGIVTLLAPDHPAFNTPNKITAADFTGWTQERGINFPDQWDTAHYTTLLECNDVGEAPLKSGLLAAHYGKGWFVYSGLSFFRQLPAGVPGAYRLFANLISLGKDQPGRDLPAQ
jgi:LmbE family N-acetylglucosaminyl deacetylase